MTRLAGPFLLVLLIALTPLFVAVIPPIHDYPFHLARMEILASLPHSPFLRAHYEVGSYFLPNVGMDVAMMPLYHLFPIVTAGRVFLGLTLALILSGTVALHAAIHRRVSVWPLLAAFLLYNWIFLFGFLNYILGIGLALWAAAAWIAMMRRPALWRIVVGSVLSVAVLFCHLSAFGVLALIVGGFELQRAGALFRSDRLAAVRGLALAAVPMFVALAVFVAVSPASGEAHQMMGYRSGLGWKPMIAYRTLFTTIGWLDILTLTPIAVGAAWLMWRKRVRVAPGMIVPFGLLVLAFLVLPFYIFGSEYGDARIPIAIAFVGIASTTMDRVPRAMLLAVVALLTVRSVVIARDWMESDSRIAAITDAFHRLPKGATLFTATAGPYPSLNYIDEAGLALWHPPLKHIASLAGLEPDVFVPSIWSDPSKQPMYVAPAFQVVKQLQGDNPFKTQATADLSAVFRKIAALPVSPSPTYMLLLFPDRLQGGLPAEATMIAHNGDFALMKLP